MGKRTKIVILNLMFYLCVRDIIFIWSYANSFTTRLQGGTLHRTSSKRGKFFRSLWKGYRRSKTIYSFSDLYCRWWRDRKTHCERTCQGIRKRYQSLFPAWRLWRQQLFKRANKPGWKSRYSFSVIFSSINNKGFSV